jgi:hypothetical protein
MMDDARLVAEVTESWREQGIVRQPAAGWALDELAARRRITLPEPFRRLWASSDGTASMDDDEIIFWPLDNISDDPSLEPAAERADKLVFADWRLTGAVFYVLFVEGQAGAVIREHARDRSRISVAPSFAEFLARYLEDPSELLPARR